MAYNDTIDIIKDKIENLPLVDVTVFEVIDLLNNPESNFEQIIDKLSPDVATRFLNMANSAYYGREVRSINHAVRLIGYKEMKQILITAIVMDHFIKHVKGFNLYKFQKQAQFCAAVSRVLGEILNYNKLEDLFTVSILHNIGKLVIAVYFKEDHRKVNELKQSEGLSANEAEQRILGISHAEIGALVLHRFNIPHDICDAVKYHDADNRDMSDSSNYQLELIIRESARIVGNFTLPEEMKPLEIIDRLNGAIDEGRSLYREKVREEMLSRGYNEVLPVLIKQASVLVYRDLKKILKERIG